MFWNEYRNIYDKISNDDIYDYSPRVLILQSRRHLSITKIIALIGICILYYIQNVSAHVLCKLLHEHCGKILQRFSRNARHNIFTEQSV